MNDNEKDIEQNLNDENEEKLNTPQSDGQDTVKYETSDSWEFDAQAPTLRDDVFENTGFTVDTEELKIKKPEAPASTPAVEENNGGNDTVVKRDKLVFIPTAVLLVAITAVLIFLGVRYYTVPNGKEGDLMNPASVVATVDGEKVSVGMFNYYFSSMVNYYESYASYGYFDLDTTKDYATQYTEDEDGNKISWLDFFKNETMNEIKSVTAYYNAGIKAGVTLTEKQKETIDTQIESLKTSASEQSISLEDYIEKNFGEYCTEATLRLMLEQYYIMSNYKGMLAADIQVTDEEIDKYFADNKTDYYTINFSYLATEYDSSTEETKQNSEKIIKDYMAKVTDRESIIALVPEIYKDYIEQDAQSAMESDSKLTKAEAIDKATENYEGSIDGTITGEDAPFSEEITSWLFSEETPVGSTNYYVDEDAGYAYIILKTEQATLSDEETYTVRHILIQPEAEESTDDQSSATEYTDEQWAAAEKKANEILEKYNAGDKTEYSFALLAENNSTDTASTSAGSSGAFGGLYEGVRLGEMVPEFEDWSVDEARKYGDTAIVKSDYGYHIMFFVNKCPSYESQIISKVKNDKILEIEENAEFDLHQRVMDNAINGFFTAKKESASENTTAASGTAE